MTQTTLSLYFVESNPDESFIGKHMILHQDSPQILPGDVKACKRLEQRDNV